MDTSDPKRESLVLSFDEWEEMNRLAHVHGALYREQPSWRILIRMIARKELVLVAADNEAARLTPEPTPPEPVAPSEGPDRYYHDDV